MDVHGPWHGTPIDIRAVNTALGIPTFWKRAFSQSTPITPPPPRPCPPWAPSGTWLPDVLQNGAVLSMEPLAYAQHHCMPSLWAGPQCKKNTLGSLPRAYYAVAVSRGIRAVVQRGCIGGRHAATYPDAKQHCRATSKGGGL